LSLERREEHRGRRPGDRVIRIVRPREFKRTDGGFVATEDALHQGPRSKIFPALPRLIGAAVDAGAHGAFLSGAGSAVLAFVTDSEAAVKSAMEYAGAQSGISGRVECLAIARLGASIEAS